MSDHLPVYAVKVKHKVVYEEKVIESRSYRKFDETLFLGWLVEADWDGFYQIHDPSDAWLFIENPVNMYLDRVFKN